MSVSIEPPNTNESINEEIISQLLCLNIGTRNDCINAYLSSNNKTNINEMKQYLLTKSSNDTNDSTNDNMTDSYTDDIKENIEDIIEDEMDNNNSIDKNNNELELLPIGLLPKYEQKTFQIDETIVEETSPIYSWSLCDATTFDVRRGPNYISGQKSPSKPAIYEAFAMDTYSVPFKINKITQFMNIQKYIKKYSYKMNNKYPLPPVIVINIMVPNYSPEISNYKSYNGKGYQVIIYARLSDNIKKLLMHCKDNSEYIPQSIKLLSRFIIEGNSNTLIRDRFKCLGRVMNLKYTGFNYLTKKLIKEYNAKPFLAKCSTIIHCKQKEYLCIDLDAHQFGYLAKKCWNYIKTIMDHVIYDLAFIIEGQSNDELPEQILTSVRISKVAAQKQRLIPQIYVDKFMETKKIQK